MTTNTINLRKRASKVTTLSRTGRSVSLADLPLVAYSLSCGHLGRDYAIQKRDLVFCADCQGTRRVSKVLAQ